jgi:glycosyltransferase involved in cell wall biosynthesis
MHAGRWWRTKKGVALFGRALGIFLGLAAEDLYFLVKDMVSWIAGHMGLRAFLRHWTNKCHALKDPEGFYQTWPSAKSAASADVPAKDPVKPSIFVSACVSREIPGDYRFCGGIKELNYLVMLLRDHGYDAWMVTYDGQYRPWLIEHQPHISLSEFRLKSKLSCDIRCVTSLANADAFIRECRELFFWDMDLVMTNNAQFSNLSRLYRTKIKKTAAISRTIQAWHMAHFGMRPVVIPNLLDDRSWFPVPVERKRIRVGYMNEGGYVGECLRMIREKCRDANLTIEFQLIEGVEDEVLRLMRTCNVFLSMNIGKDAFWGEGCPRTTIEAMACGCVVVAFDVIGNREMIQDGFNGMLVSGPRAELMAEALIRLYKDPELIEGLRQNSLAMIRTCHSLERRWPLVKEFLLL